MFRYAVSVICRIRPMFHFDLDGSLGREGVSAAPRFSNRVRDSLSGILPIV